MSDDAFSVYFRYFLLTFRPTCRKIVIVVFNRSYAMQDHRWNLLIIIHNSLGMSEYGSRITAQRLCVGHSPPPKYDNCLKV